MTQSFCALIAPIDSTISKFWEVEEIVEPPAVSPNDLDCEKLYKSTYKREASGCYTVALPFKENPDLLGVSFSVALKRFSYLEKRFTVLPELRVMYNKIMKDYIAQEFMSKLSDEIPFDFGYYIPHHGVYKPTSVSTPLRIIFDASTKTNNGR